MFGRKKTKRQRIVRAAIPLRLFGHSDLDRLSEAIALMPGIMSMNVSRAASCVFLSFDNSKISSDEIMGKIRDLGFDPLKFAEEPVHSTKNSAQETIRACNAMFVRFVLAAFLSVAILVGERFAFSGFTFSVLALVAWFATGWNLHKGALRALRRKKADMPLLAMISCAAIFLHGVLTAIFPAINTMYNPHWHDIPLLIMFINFGLWIELRYKAESVKSLEKLFRITPTFARRVGDKGEEIITVDEVQKGDILLIRPGEQIPADGFVSKGMSSVDESLLTGEAVPATKAAGSSVFAGTFNQEGWFEFRTTAVGDETSIMKIAFAVNESKYDKKTYSGAADRFSAWFVPISIFIAIVSSMLWILLAWDYSMAFSVFFSVISVACPVAIGISVPLSIRIGFGRARSLGVLIRNTDILDIVKTSDTVIFDKTGTITDGSIELKSMHPYGIVEEELLNFMALAEDKSDHPLAQAVRNEAKARSIYPRGILAFTAYPGRGVKVSCEQGEIKAGSLLWFEMENISIPANVRNEAIATADSLLMIAVNGQFKGYASFGGRIRKNAADVVRELRKMNIEPVLASGDSSKAVENAARETGIDIFHSGVFPDDKRNIIRRYKALGKSTVMVGDGFNDAPALSAADIGISLRSGADLAAEASDVTLMHDDLKSVVDTILVLKRIRAAIRQNMTLAFLFSLIMIILASGALYPFFGFVARPQWSAATSLLAIVLIILNSFRLRSMKL